MKTITGFICLLVALSMSVQVLNAQHGATKDVWPGYQGWVGDPDSVTVKILPPCSHDDSVAIINSIKTWNDMETDPKFKLVSSGDAQITIKKDDNLKGRTGITEHQFAEPGQNLSTPHERTGAAITFDSNNGVSVQQIVTHELGHCLGLRDVNNPNSVMRKDAYSGASAIPSRHDTTEVEQSFLQGSSSYGLEHAEEPENAIIPGGTGELKFPTNDYIPPGSYNGALVVVESLDPDVYIETVFLDSLEEALFVNVYVVPEHPNSQLYILATIFLPRADNPVSFLGMHYININPIPPLTFECPMNIYVEDGWVHIDWVESCTHPFNDSLRSSLTVDIGTERYCLEIASDGDYILDLEPGQYTFTLHVDDFQVNSAVSTQEFILTGIEPLEDGDAILAWPNPFGEWCRISLDKPGRIEISDLNGKLVKTCRERTFLWKPGPDIPPGIYLIKAAVEDRIYRGKVVYKPH